MKSLKTFSLTLVALVLAVPSFAQLDAFRIPPRKDDHFQRSLLVHRIDLDEKLNSYMVRPINRSLYAEAPYGETDGVIAALFNGLKSGKYLAYDPDDLNESLTWEDVRTKSARLSGPELEDPDFPDFPDEEIFPDEDIFPIDDEDDTFIDVDDLTRDSGPVSSDEMDLSPYETVLEIIEHRIFDKNRSQTVNDIQFIRLVWVDPGEAIPDVNFVCIKYSDVLETLEDTYTNNRHNDAEARNMREAFELRMFHSFLTNVSGKGIRTMEETQFRRDQLVAFDHHLWSY